MKRATNSINKKLPTVAGKSETIIKTTRSGHGSGHTFKRSTKIILIALLMILMVLSYNMYYHIQSNDENKSIMNVKEENPSSTAGVEVKEPEKKKDPLKGWIYEPKNINYFWSKMGDRPFQKEFYSQLGQFKRILDVGARGYNRVCKDIISSSTTEYIQIEPFPPSADEMNNDGLLECYVQEIMDKYPNMKDGADMVIDFGVFGWDGVQIGFKEEDIRKYIQNVLFVLKDGGCWALKTDVGWVPDQDQLFNKYILPYFDLGNFNNYKSGHSVKGNKFHFYFFYKKKGM